MKKAVDKKYPDAFKEYGNMLIQGRGVDKNPSLGSYYVMQGNGFYGTYDDGDDEEEEDIYDDDEEDYEGGYPFEDFCFGQDGFAHFPFH